MRKILVFLVLCTIINTGCASMAVYSASKRQVYNKKVAELKKNAVKAYADGEGTVGIGIDIFALEVLKEHPVKQFGAALLDAGLLYGTYEGVQYLQDQSSESTTYNISITGNYNNVVIVDGSENITVNTEQNYIINGE